MSYSRFNCVNIANPLGTVPLKSLAESDLLTNNTD